MDFARLYAEKKITAAQAAALVKSGDWVDYGWTTGTPVAVDAAIAKRLPELENVSFHGGILCWEPEIFKVENAVDHMTWNSWHMSGIERKAEAKGFSFYCPMRYSELPRYYRDGNAKADFAVFQVAPMDEHGFFNFGPNASHMGAVCETAKIVVVEVNKNMPRCLGGSETGISIENVDYIVEGNNPPIGIIPAPGAPTAVDTAVAKQIVPLIPNGACLQLGIGGMPNAVGGMIAESDLKDLGVHTEMYVDAFVDIAKAGKINGSRKSIDKGRQVYAFGAGTQKLYDYVNDNPECMAAPVDYTNDVRTVSELDNFISINNAVDIDLFGQVNAESAGPRNISGAGGQLDFVLGAYLSHGGKSFICLSSTFMNKKTGKAESRIAPTLAPGSIVTDTRANIHYLCTEYGCVNLKGLPAWQKAEAIISVAHPDFRDELIDAAAKMNIWRRSNKR
jgi:butyryl-CoA:acetate CoA-transferase